VRPGEVREIAEVLAHLPIEERVRSFDLKAATESEVSAQVTEPRKLEADERKL
jgi:hypothetical protein